MAPRKRAPAHNGGCSSIELPNEWKVGDKLGEGAQGSVFAVLDKNNQDTTWAVKVTIKPTAKKSKKEETIRANATSLQNEGLLYKAHLKPLRGTIVPKTPEEWQGVKESRGYLYLLMERMDCDLLGKATLERLVDEARSNHRDAVSVGPLASRMIKLVQTIHSRARHLVIDVKPENFMFAACSGEDDESDLVERLRLVDFGLMRAFQRPDPPPSQLQGNALFASLHMHTLETQCSRRDDVEMVLYVIAELILRLQVHIRNHNGSNGSNGDTAKELLPWSGETSDDAVGEVKKTQVTDESSEFYTSMPRAAAQTIHQCLEQVWSYKFKTEPDYQALSHRLSALTVPLPKSTTTKRRRPSRAAAASAAATNVDVDDDETMTGSSVSSPSTPSKRPATSAPTSSSRRARRLKRDKVADDETEASDSEADAVHMEVDQYFYDVEEAQEGRDGDDGNHNNEEIVMQDEDDGDTAEDENGCKEKEGVIAVKLSFQTPGQPDLTYRMTGDETIYLGTDPKEPKSKKGDADGATLIQLTPAAGTVSATHCKLTLFCRRQRVLHVVVKDCNKKTAKSKATTSVGRLGVTSKRNIAAGGQANCMIPGQIYIGKETVIELERL